MKCKKQCLPTCKITGRLLSFLYRYVSVTSICVLNMLNIVSSNVTVLVLLLMLVLYCAQDLLYVISYGPSQVKPPAVQMLFHYWPNLKPPGAISEYRGLQYTGQIQLMSHLLLNCPWAVLWRSNQPSIFYLNFFSLSIFCLLCFLDQPGTPSTVNILSATTPSISLPSRWF